MATNATVRATRAKQPALAQYHQWTIRWVEYTHIRRCPDRLMRDLMTNNPLIPLIYERLGKDEIIAFWSLSKRCLICVEQHHQVNGHKVLLSHRIEVTQNGHLTPSTVQAAAHDYGYHFTNIDMFEDIYSKSVEYQNGSYKYGTC